ncbi:hypothetical protein AKO1_015031 [Acrasis kona]|uniref:MYND-type domain-containing protein n=1 Tax=Acrasis kona TaxID=1008807 RepID=A0AAW2ZHR4_9EUKA
MHCTERDNRARLGIMLKMVESKGQKKDPEVYNEIALCYYKGSGTEVDMREARKWFQKSADMNNVRGRYHVGHIYDIFDHNIEKANEYYLKTLTTPGNEGYEMECKRRAKLALAVNYECKLADLRTAEKYYRSAIQDGDVQAVFNLGNMLHKEGNIKEAIKLYEIGVARDEPQSTFMLGQLCMLGPDHSIMDMDRAEELLNKASRMGVQDARGFLSKLTLIRKKFKEEDDKIVLYHCATCNKPEKPEERLRNCSACKKVKYCSRECQVQDWKEHKLVCTKNGQQSSADTPKTQYKIVATGIPAARSTNSKHDLFSVHPTNMSNVDTTIDSSGGMEMHIINGIRAPKIKKDALRYLKRYMSAPAKVNYLPWDKCIECPYCRNSSKDGGIMITEIMFRRMASSALSMRSMPRIWHVDCCKDMFEKSPSTEVASKIDLESFTVAAVDKIWERTEKDVEVFQGHLSTAMNNRK